MAMLRQRSNCTLAIYSSGRPCCVMNSLVSSTLDCIFPLVLLCKCSSRSKAIRGWRSPGEVTQREEQAYAPRSIKSTSSNVSADVISVSLRVWTIAKGTRSPDLLNVFTYHAEMACEGVTLRTASVTSANEE